MLWPDDVTDEQLALAAATCDEDEQTREGNENESFGFQISSCYFDIFDRELQQTRLNEGYDMYCVPTQVVMFDKNLFSKMSCSRGHKQIREDNGNESWGNP